jgi:Fur family ferric uptake transcriptional regulator
LITSNIDAMAKKRQQDWAEHAMQELQQAGYRQGEARKAVVELLAKQDCALSAQQIEDRLHSRDRAVGRASVYRALEQLERLRLVQRVDIGTGTASYEPLRPTGEHHHHLVCDSCGTLVPFEDPRLEQAINRVSRNASFKVSDHDVTLRGLCRSCAS